MKRAALFTILCMLFAAGAYAQQADPSDAPASREDVMRLLDVMHSRELAVNMMNMVAKQSSQMVHQQVIQHPDLPPDAEARINKMAEDIVKNFPVDDLIEVIIPIYQEHFTKGEIDAVVAFYSSPAGQNFLKEMPAITQESVQASVAIAQKMVAKQRQQIQDDINQIQHEEKQGPK